MDEKISQLDNYTPPADTDVFPIVDVANGITKKITFANLKSEITGDDTAFVRKSLYDANTILYATTDDTPVALTVGTNSVVGRVAGNITTLAIDSDLTSVSASDDTVPSAKATKTALDLKATDSAVVKLTGDQTVAGIKTFSSDPIIPDEAYGSGWNGSLEPATKNAIYDKIETITPATFKTGQTSRATGSGTGTQNIAHGLGVTPKLVKITATDKTATNLTMTMSVGTATSTSDETCTYFTPNSVGTVTTGQDSTHILLTRTSGGTSWSATLSALDSTNITLNFDTAGDATVYIQWEAYA